MQLMKTYLALVLCAGIVFMPFTNLFADETSEVILKLLIKKGIISQKEVDQIKAQVAKDEPAVPASVTERVAKLEAKQKEIPSWVENIKKLKGDLRLRNEYIGNDSTQDDNRQRLRLRVGLESKLNDLLKVGFGLASGSSDAPTSTNQTLESEFQFKPVWIDYAYAQYTPYDWLKLTGGKFKSPFFHTDMLWDGDIRFDGIAGALTYDFSEPSLIIPDSLYLTSGYFPIDNNNNAEGDDVFLAAVQGGTIYTFGDDDYAKLKTGITFWNFCNIKGAAANTFAEERGTNTYTGTPYARGSATSFIKHDFNVISHNLELSFKDAFGAVDIPWAVFGEYAENLNVDPATEDGWRGGLRLGQAKVKKKGQWRAIGQYTHLRADVFPDIFPDADLNGGGTNNKGFEAIIDYGLSDNVILSVDYYNSESITTDQADNHIIQSDIIFKF